MIPAKLLSFGGGSAKFELENGSELIQRIKAGSKLDPLDPQCLDPDISNLIDLTNLTEKAVLHVLRIRFMRDDIYTLVSGILIACNPFKPIPIYDKKTMDDYRRSTQDNSTLPPHIFSLANEAYNSMIRSGSPQSVIITGESGAGKTESIKLILKYLARLSEMTCTSSKSVQDQILCANPLLEAFGNAKTSRNSNSSRFGKLITVNFSGGVINQASIISYLLEKSRVVHQQAGERNYHIFYQLVNACTDNVKLGVDIGLSRLSIDDYAYLSDPESSRLRDTNELESFSEVERSMEVLGIDKEQRDQIFEVVACVLRLGNVQFNAAETSDARALIDDVPEIDRICDMLGLCQSEMKRCLVSRNFGVRSIVTCFFSVQQAKESRDAFSKALYSHLFNWLIKMINLTLTHGNKSSSSTNQFIALLDIFGFENFETNSYEQLLINYCNEKLQYHFNSHIFMMEQEAYVLEDIDIGYINFKDNSPTLSVIETKVTGILSMIDEEINIPKGSDMSLLNKILTYYDKSDAVGRVRSSSKSRAGIRNRQEKSKGVCSFAIHHYAGDVPYDVTGFLEKNKDALSSDLVGIGKTSSVPFIAELFTDYEASIAKPEVTAAQKDSSRRATSQMKGHTIASQFKKQLSDLVTTLNSTDLYFVRCMKTNEERVGGLFDCELMLRQLQYSGLLEVCRIRQEGYPYRFDFQGFFCMYGKLNLSSTTGPLLAGDLEAKGLFQSDDYCIGKTKIFFKYEAGKQLEKLRGEFINDTASCCQSWVKGFLARRRFKRFLTAVKAIQSSNNNPDKQALKDIVELGSKYLPENGNHVAAVSEARKTLIRVAHEEPIMEALTLAMKNKDYAAMEVAIGQARSLSPEFTHRLVTSCEDAIKVYLKDRMKEARGSIRKQTSSGDQAQSNSLSPPPSSDSVSINENCSSSVSSTSSPQFQNVIKPPVVITSDVGVNSLWGSPSAIRAAKGKMSGTVGHSSLNGLSTITHPILDENVTPTSTTIETGNVTPPSPPPPEKKVITNDEPASKPTENVSHASDSDQIVGPSEDFKTKKRSVLVRRLSSEQIGVAAELHHMIEVLNDQCMSEEGLTPSAIRPLEVLLKKISVRDDTVSREVTDMMMAEQELIRAKKQLLLQVAVDKVKRNTPLWKLKNLAAQSHQLGMENYHGCRYLDMYIGDR